MQLNAEMLSVHAYYNLSCLRAKGLEHSGAGTRARLIRWPAGIHIPAASSTRAATRRLPWRL